ncbi:MAG: FHA domain-containing protein [Acidimicrobiales bacterium]
MSEQLLTVLKFCLLALLYLFFFRVVRAVWAEINPPKPGRVPAPAPAPAGRAPSRRQARKAAKAAPVPAAVVVGAPAAAVAPAAAPAPQLVVLEPPDQRGRSYPLGDELSVGRAAGCQVTIDDTYVSQIHARVFARDGQFLVEDLGSTNGTYLNRKKVSGPMVMQPGDQLQVGNTVMVLR